MALALGLMATGCPPTPKVLWVSSPADARPNLVGEERPVFNAVGKWAPADTVPENPARTSPS